jgi:heat shock protein HslJ
VKCGDDRVRTTIHTSWLLSAAAFTLLGLAAWPGRSSTTPATGSSAEASGSPKPFFRSGSPATGGAYAGTEGSGPAPGVERFDGSTFVTNEITGARAIVPGSTITLAFAGGSITANAGCNDLFGPYAVTGNVLSAAQLGSTAMACDQRLMAQDAWLATFLASAPTWTDDGRTLTLTNGTDTIAMARPPSGAEALTATGWKLVLLISPGRYVPMDQGVRAWVRFDGSEVAFDTSCNLGGGSAEVTDETITFGALHSTVMACDGARGDTERAMTAVMVGTTSYRLDGRSSVLTITSQDGANGLQFTADPAVGGAAATPAN